MLTTFQWPAGSLSDTWTILFKGTSFYLQSMKVKLQPPSGTELSPFSPVQPPAAITQVMLLANPMKVSMGESTLPIWGPAAPEYHL